MLENLNGGGAVLTGAKQTMASWTRVIETREEIPDIYKSFFENKTIPYTLLLPPIVKPRNRTSEKLVFDADDAIHILERKGEQVSATSYAYSKVSMLEMGRILLDSWLTISGVTDLGTANTSTLDFNTVSLRHFARFIDQLRPSKKEAGSSSINSEMEKFDALSSVNYKFMNYGRNSLMGGEVVRQILFQPEIKEPIWARLGAWFQRLVTPAHLTVLTDRELILIQDLQPSRKNQKDNYGGFWQYIRLDCIKSIGWNETNGRLVLSIAASPNREIERIFGVENREDVERLCGGSNSL